MTYLPTTPTRCGYGIALVMAAFLGAAPGQVAAQFKPLPVPDSSPVPSAPPEDLQERADRGDAKAQIEVCQTYRERKEFVASVRWCRLAAEQTDPYVYPGMMLLLGRIYYWGQGVPRSYAEAAKWIRLAAEYGEIDALWALSRLYQDGHGVPRDDVRAYAWMNLAAARRPEELEHALTELGEKLSDAELTRSQKLSACLWRWIVEERPVKPPRCGE